MRKRNKIWVDKGSKFYHSFFKKWLEDDDIEMYSAHNEKKSVVVERFFRAFKNEPDKHMTVVSKKLYILINWML